MIVALVIALLIFFNALYVAAEFSSVSARKTRILQLAEEGNRFALILNPILSDSQKLDNYVAACQLGITASSLVLGFYGQDKLAHLLLPLLSGAGNLQEAAADSISVTVVLLFLTTLQVLFGELVPKSIGVRFPEELALMTVVPMTWSVKILAPFTWLFNGAGRLILRLLGVPLRTEGEHAHQPEEIEWLVAESAEDGQLDVEEREMLRNVFRLGDLIARQVMIPRPRIVAAPVDMKPRQLLELLADSPYTRIPIYEKDIDHIIGLIHLKDLFQVCFGKEEEKHTVRALLREITYVPATMPVDSLWPLLKSGRFFMAIVLDEYGGTAGMITQEDLIEEIFGELQDEFDQESPLIEIDSNGDVIIRGDVLVEDINEYLLLNLPTGQAVTVGGLVMNLLGRRPIVGDHVEIGSQIVRVREVDDLAISRVSLALPEGTVPFLDGERAE